MAIIHFGKCQSALLIESVSLLSVLFETLAHLITVLA